MLRHIEPIAARRKGASVKVFAVSETGNDPYTMVLAVSGAGRLAFVEMPDGEGNAPTNGGTPKSS